MTSPKTKPPPAERFFAKVEIPVANGIMDDAATCWRWTGARMSAGYGIFRVGHGLAPVLAHRFSFELENGPIPKDREIDHLCRNRLCVNPAHLDLVTRRENQRRGIRPRSRRLQIDKAHRLRRAGLSVHEIAAALGVCRSRAYNYLASTTE